MHRRRGVAVRVAQRLDVYVYDGALAAFLSVVDVAYDGYEIVHRHLVGQAVLAVEAYRRGIVLVEEVVGVHYGVVVAEECDDACALVGVGGVLEVVRRHLLILLYEALRHDELLHSVLARVLEHLLARELRHGVAHLEGWVHQYAVEAREHLGIHAAHRRAYDEVGLLLGCHRLQHLQTFFGMQRNVARHNRSVGHQRAQHLHRARLCRRTESVYIHEFLAPHKLGVLLYKLIFHCRLSYKHL